MLVFFQKWSKPAQLNILSLGVTTISMDMPHEGLTKSKSLSNPQETFILAKEPNFRQMLSHCSHILIFLKHINDFTFKTATILIPLPMWL